MLPSPILDIGLDIICNTAPNNKEENRDPLNLNPVCTKFLCDRCGGEDWFADLGRKIQEKNLRNSEITYSQWVTEYRDKK